MMNIEVFVAQRAAIGRDLATVETGGDLTVFTA